MRSLPAGWPDPSELVQSPPLVYLKVIGSSWPPASTDSAGNALAAGWGECGSWSIDWDLDAPLMPGQVTAQVNPTYAQASCTIAHPEGKILAPWRTGDERTPEASKAELWASYDGPTGSTAFLLGQFILDPMQGKASERFISLSMVQDLVRLKKAHDLPTRISSGFGFDVSPTRFLEAGATKNGFTLSSTADFSAVVDSSYFPGKTDELSAMQSIVASNLGAMFLSMDGTTIRVLDPDYLLGTGSVLETIDVLDKLDDISWSQDPNAAVDRIEVVYLPPDYDDAAFGPAPYSAARVWRAPKGVRLTAGQSRTFRFDPGSFISLDISGGVVVYGNSAKDGTGTSVNLPADVDQISSGRWTVTITNNTGSTRYLVAPRVSGGFPASDFSKGTTSFLAGTIDGASESDGQATLTWGKSAATATNVLTFNLGRNIQRKADAQAILNRIISRVTSPTYVLDDVRVVPNLGREIADLYRLQYPEVGFNTRAMVTGLKLSGVPGEVQQSMSLAVIPLTVQDLNDSWDAVNSSLTVAAFNTAWAGKTVADFDIAPLKTAP